VGAFQADNNACNDCRDRLDAVDVVVKSWARLPAQD
jgi:hypothetical protein